MRPSLFEEPAFKDTLGPVLTDFPLWQTTLYFVYISRKYVPLKIRSFIDFVIEFSAAMDAQTRAAAAPPPGPTNPYLPG